MAASLRRTCLPGLPRVHGRANVFDIPCSRLVSKCWENRYGPMEASMLHKCNRQINWRGWGQCFCALNQFLIGHVIGAKLLRSQYNHCRKCQICLFVLELTEWVRFKLKIWFTSHLYFNYVTKCYLFYNTKMCVCFNPLG